MKDISRRSFTHHLMCSLLSFSLLKTLLDGDLLAQILIKTEVKESKGK